MNYLPILIRTALGGLSNNISKLAINSIPLYYFVSLRYLGMLIILLFTSKGNLIKDTKTVLKNKKLFKSMLLSASLSGIGSIFFYIGLKNLPVSVVSLFDNSFHLIFSVLFGILFYKNKKSFKFYVLFILLFPCMYLIAFKDLGFDLSLSVLGISMLCLNGIVGGFEAHLTKYQLDNVSISYNVFFKTVVSLIFSIICIFIFDNSFDDLIKGFTYIVLFSLLYGILNSYIIKMLHSKSIKDIGVIQTSIFTTLTPVFSIIFAMLMFGEFLTLTQWIGVLCLIAILYFIKGK